MSDAGWEPLPAPDVTHLVTEDDAPVDNIRSEKNQRLLTGALYASWAGPPAREDDEAAAPDGRRHFLAAANVGLFVSPTVPPIVPDVLLSTDVTVEALTATRDEKRAYLMWEMGKLPELVIELVSNREGEELTKKRAKYGRAHISSYVVFDPVGYLGGPPLRAFELRGDVLRPMPLAEGATSVRLETLGLGLTLWEGVFEDTHATWLRFVDADGALLLTGDELALREKTRADEATARADEATARADEATARAAQLEARLRALGVDPDASE
jgi:Uma2 family endonuclease